jgi:peptidoglycan hydrolase CwlO-like protein
MERDEQLVLEQIAEKQSKLENLTYQRDSIQRDLDAVLAQIVALQGDVDILQVKNAAVIEKQAAEILAEREILVEKV